MRRNFKISLIGGDNVGKSCFLHRILTDQFDTTIPPTVDVQHKMKTISIDKEIIDVDIYDTPARTLAFSPISMSDGFLVFYDITDPITLEESSRCIKEISEQAVIEIPIMLVGSKCDKEDQRKVTLEKVSDLVKSEKIELIGECSSVDGTSVNKVFTDIVKAILVKEKEGEGKKKESFFSRLLSFFKK